MKTSTCLFLVLTALVIALLRIFHPFPMPPPETTLPYLTFEIYKDAAHIFIGTMLVGWLMARSYNKAFPSTFRFGEDLARFRFLFIMLCLVEIGCSAPVLFKLLNKPAVPPTPAAYHQSKVGLLPPGVGVTDASVPVTRAINEAEIPLPFGDGTVQTVLLPVEASWNRNENRFPDNAFTWTAGKQPELTVSQIAGLMYEVGGYSSLTWDQFKSTPDERVQQAARSLWLMADKAASTLTPNIKREP